MSDFDPAADSDMQKLHVEAMMLYQGVQIRLLEEALNNFCESSGATFDGKSLSAFLAERRDDAFRDLLRTLSDADPEHASKLARFFEAMKRGDFR